jgi:hypothetical protein
MIYFGTQMKIASYNCSGLSPKYAEPIYYGLDLEILLLDHKVSHTLDTTPRLPHPLIMHANFTDAGRRSYK